MFTGSLLAKSLYVPDQTLRIISRLRSQRNCVLADTTASSCSWIKASGFPTSQDNSDSICYFKTDRVYYLAAVAMELQRRTYIYIYIYLRPHLVRVLFKICNDPWWNNAHKISVIKYRCFNNYNGLRPETLI